MVTVGILAGLASGLLGNWLLAPAIGWAVAAVLYIGWVWVSVAPLDAATTAAHATREDPSRGITDLLLILASLASLGSILIVLVQARAAEGAGQGLLAALALVVVALSWVLVHTLFALRYASLYYADDDGGVDFNQLEPPRYADFAYLSFTVGMTFQVSDTSLTSSTIRAVALRHALMSFLFGSIILATLINLVAGL
ncbi:DUF1345 domain-containing protein [Cryobacterium sp. TMN-39-2]|uniref:DUF1345 domain-containing protein n=2 Tax=Microbacteriaceae TaxID=85023 RepID=A0A2S3ZJD2_9MICO|nr:hypothetical protein B7495_08610 [Cryobacterium sp. LW097]POH62040.1 DUF1345 domain-containing protein [Cryobacterium zongtaii]TFC45467.1 DUF1345 domain-containing protein [Cryobacterium sp. TMN-39-2]TFC55776.1 DUF1345 domain-containing protein [Cryobacterium sp. TMB3-1-2]TFC73015.1 DUF1345 domain-containing protein [Cryobacterium sp. TMB3-15]TFC76560.1 DUF1345 domain-containing protein [Cryobacterium sp. TMB3-10]TFC87262.1 DUF1345 domain-containing protein [Cryobacterium sp. TMT4-31]TFD4